ncbi:MAG: c-type cytochrome [Acidobacteria bacterium]|nr:MAG: c-type cytochrome [Acidobacteriota bacterium]
MKVHKLWTAARESRARKGSLTQGIGGTRRSWLTIAAVSVVVCSFVVVAAARNQSANSKAQPGQESPPYWAFTVDPPARASLAPAEKPSGHTLHHVPGSKHVFTQQQIDAAAFAPPDWHPDGHPPMPEIVAHGRKPAVEACGFCHLPNGQGRLENSSLAGLPAAYIIQQLADFKVGLRKPSMNTGPIDAMITHETKANTAEIKAAAEYFSQVKPKPWIRVVETRTVPKTHVAGWMLVRSAGGGKEPIGHRIIETPVNQHLTELRDDASGFIAYVPVGSVEKGKELVTTGGAGKTIDCEMCHGPGLRGKGNVPSLAGRSPSYIVRQLYDFRSGSRNGPGAELMKPVTAKLTIDDMISLAAYLASLHP